MQAESGFVQHAGFQCDNYGTEPIQVFLWHCQDCPPILRILAQTNFHETDTHMEDHQLESVYGPETFLETTGCPRSLVIMTLTQSAF